MSIMVAELYYALRDIGLPDEQARAAASAVAPQREEVVRVSELNALVTKADLKALRADFIRWSLPLMLLLAAVGFTLAKMF
jgi:hypothetical protein